MRYSKLVLLQSKMDAGEDSSEEFLLFRNTSTNMTTAADVNDSDARYLTPPVFDDMNMIKTLVMGTMFFVSLFGNVATIVQMYRMRRRKSTVNTLIVNLATADLLVTFFCMGTEAVWASTVQWYAGNVMCKAVKFAQVFALNLSTCVTVVISLDRCCVILDPMSRNKAPKRVRTMIMLSYLLCALFSIPQIFIFRVEQGPFKERFVQCIDLGYTVQWGRKAYSIVSALFSFVIPLLIMGSAYGLISGTITRKSKDFREPESSSYSSEAGQFRGQVRSHLFRKAKRKALRMSIVIVAAFIVCWTPYYALFTCFTFLNVQQMPRKTMLALSFIGLSNSLLNPMIYGAFQLCKVHSPRSWRRREWQSYYTRDRQCVPPEEDYSSASQPVPPQGRLVVLNQKKNIVVLCHCQEGSCSDAGGRGGVGAVGGSSGGIGKHQKERSRKQCLFVLYKVNPSNVDIRVLESGSSV